MINMSDCSILSKVYVQSTNISPERSWRGGGNIYLFGLKSLVTIDPGSRTRVSLGSSPFAKVY